MSSDKSPQLAMNGPVATITLSRPQEHNRLDPGDMDVLLSHFLRITSSPDVRVLIITGSGDKTFCSGYTLQAVRGDLEERDRLDRMLDTLESLPLPVICRINGAVFGAGMDLALCCDYCIGISGTRMSMPASKFGMLPYPGALRRHMSRLGLAASKKIFFTSGMLPAEEMLRIGFLDELVEPEQLDEAVGRYVSAMLAAEPGVVRMMKHHLNLIAEGKADPEGQRADYIKTLQSEELEKRMTAMKRK